MLWIIYNLLFPIVFLFMLPKFISRMLKRGGYGQHFEQRIGHFGRQTKERLREHRRIWVHAVSVGEIYVALRFIKAYRAQHPEARFALSTTTSTAHKIGQTAIDERDVLFYFPVDLPVIIAKVLRIIEPQRIVLMEGEFWPNLIRMADNRGIPIALVNGRLSEKSCRGYKRLKSLTKDILRRIDPICVQGELDAARMREIGAPAEQIHVMGTVKFDVAERDPEGERTAQQVMKRIGVPDNAVVLLGGSTWPGEEEVLCSIYKKLRAEFPGLFLVLVPRHVERAAAVVECIEGCGLTVARRSEADAAAPREEPPDVLFVDTTGELRNFYSAAQIIFVGKSLCEHGGQNPIEPAMYGKAVVVGPNMENFPAVMPEFLNREAILQAADAAALEAMLRELLRRPERQAELGARAGLCVDENRGAIERTVELIGE